MRSIILALAVASFAAVGVASAASDQSKPTTGEVSTPKSGCSWGTKTKTVTS